MSDLLLAQLATYGSNKQPAPPTIASAATIAPSTFLTFVTGTTTISTVTPFVTGMHMIALVFTNASPPQMSSGTGVGSLKVAITPAQNVPVFLMWDPSTSLWWPLSSGTARLGTAQAAQTQPTNPTGTASTTMVMMGLAGALTPTGTRVMVTLSGDVSQSTTADGAKWQLSFGTGSAPANAAALTGTQFGSNPTMTFLTGVLLVPFSTTAIITGLTAGTAIWVDVALAAVTGGTASMTNLSLSISELP